MNLYYHRSVIYRTWSVLHTMATASCSSFVSTASILTNYARLGLVTQNELQNILRKLLFLKELPHLLEAHLINNLPWNLKAHEWNVLKTVRTNQYNDFDVPLLHKIILNLNLVPRPIQGWDHHTPPLTTEITIEDNIERIRQIRNEIIHRGNINVQSKSYEVKQWICFKNRECRDMLHRRGNRTKLHQATARVIGKKRNN